MANSPVTPSDVLATIPEANAKVCRKLSLSLLKFPVQFYKFLRWMLNDDGSLSDDFKAAMGVPSGQVPTTTPLSPPSGVSATDGDFNDKIVISWSPVTAAASYEVFRSVSSDFATATSRGTPTTTSFEDTNITVGTTYFYWVRARDAGSNTSSPSISDTGFAAAAGSGGGGTLLLQRYNQSGEFVVPAGVTSLWAKLWAPGGGGGSGRAPFLVIPPSGTTIYGGGGGGSGQYISVGGIPVTPGEILSFTVASIGGAGSTGTQPGGQGLATELKRSSGSVIARAIGGHGGTFGGNLPSSGGAGGGGGGVSEGTLLDSINGTNGTAGSSGPYPTPPAGGAGAPENTGGGNYGGAGGSGYLSYGLDGGGGKIEFYK